MSKRKSDSESEAQTDEPSTESNKRRRVVQLKPLDYDEVTPVVSMTDSPPGRDTDVFNKQLEFSTLLEETRQELEAKIATSVRNHPLYSFAILVSGALGHGNQQVNPALLFETSEARKLMESILTNIRLAFETRENIENSKWNTKANLDKNAKDLKETFESIMKTRKNVEAKIVYFDEMLKSNSQRSLVPFQLSPEDRTMKEWLHHIDSDREALRDRFHLLHQRIAQQREIIRTFAPYDGKRFKTAILTGIKNVSANAGLYKKIDSLLSKREFANVRERIEDKLASIKRTFNSKPDDGSESMYRLAFLHLLVVLPYLINFNPLGVTSFQISKNAQLHSSVHPHIRNLSLVIYHALKNIQPREKKASAWDGVKLGDIVDRITPLLHAQIQADVDLSATAHGDTSFEDSQFFPAHLNLEIDVHLEQSVASILDIFLSEITQRISPLTPIILHNALVSFITETSGLIEQDTQGEDLLGDDILENTVNWSSERVIAMTLKQILSWKPAVGSDKSDVSLIKKDHKLEGFIDKSEEALKTSDDSTNDFFDYFTKDRSADLPRFKLDPFRYDPLLATEQQPTTSWLNQFDNPDTLPVSYLKAIAKTPLDDPVKDFGDPKLNSAFNLVMKLRQWLVNMKNKLEKPEAFDAQLQQLRQQGIKLGIPLTDEDRPFVTHPYDDIDTVINNQIVERTSAIQTKINNAMTELDHGSGIGLRPDILYGSSQAFSQINSVRPDWVRSLKQWQTIATSRHEQAKTLFAGATAGVINEAAVSSGTRGFYIQNNVRTVNVANTAQYLASLIEIPPYDIANRF